MHIHADIYCTNVITSVRYTWIEVNIKYSKINWETTHEKGFVSSSKFEEEERKFQAWRYLGNNLSLSFKYHS